MGGANLPIVFNGSGAQTLTNAGTFSSPITINKTSGTAVLGSNFTTGSTCTVTAGTLNINGYNFTCGGAFMVGNGGTLSLIGSEISTSPTLAVGSTVVYWGDGDTAADQFMVRNWPYYNLSLSTTDSSDTLTASSILPTTGLSGYWNLDEATGIDPADSSGNNSTATANGTTSVVGKFTNARDFNGSSDYLSVANPVLPTGDFTYSAWVYLDSNADEMIFMAPTITGTNAFYVWVTGGNIKVNINNTDRFTSNGTIPTGQWVHLAVTRSGGTILLYVNGIQDTATGNYATAVTFGTCPFYLGVDIDAGNCSSSMGNYVDGKIDEARIYNRALSGLEIGNLYFESSTPLYSVAGNLTISSGIFIASPTLTLGGNFIFSNSTAAFTHNNSNVIFNDASKVSTIDIAGAANPSVTFGTLSIATAGKRVNFPAGKTVKIDGALNIQGTPGNQIILNSTSIPTQWTIFHGPTATENITNTIITNAACDGSSSTITVDSSDTNGGNNGTCWAWPAPNQVRVKGNTRIKSDTRVGDY